MPGIIEKAAMHRQQGLPFAAYCKPHSDELVGIFQHDDALHFAHDFTGQGFVFAPFHTNEPVLIPVADATIDVEYFKAVPEKMQQFVPAAQQQRLREDFETRVQAAVDAIKSGALRKVVLSRKEPVALASFEFETVFKALLNQNPGAFAYCFFHPKVGLWFGAFAEQLLKVDSGHFATMAVAGTQPLDLHATWGEKEIEEQKIVTDYIVGAIESHAESFAVSGPYNLAAGNVMHLKTDVGGVLKTGSQLRELITKLHPTPAVCGLPKLAAKAYILSNEGYDREFYSGFFGELNTNPVSQSNSTDLYVNLRCMQIKPQQAILYTGCGITKDSSPHAEWHETVNKTLAMKQILDLAL